MQNKVPQAPRATYRVQLNGQFTFDQAAGIADYLAQLGISHLYASPYLQAVPGSMHGYDVVDHGHVNREVGGSDGHQRLCQVLRRLGLGQVLDIVPNHMAVGGRFNALWWDVLENGQVSRWAGYFDIDWHGPEPKLRGKVLLPVLDGHIGQVIEQGQIKLKRQGWEFRFDTPAQETPACLESMNLVLHAAGEICNSSELHFVADVLEAMVQTQCPPEELPRPSDWTVTGQSWAGPSRSVAIAQTASTKQQCWTQLANMIEREAEVGPAIDAAIEEVNRSPSALLTLLDRQHYRLAYWKTAGRELNYRRFFSVDNLVGLRIDDPAVFGEAHQLVLDWVKQGLIQGLRVDHPDGLAQPEEYMHRLRRLAGDAWIVVEKILQPDERLIANWPVQGTTGYEFLSTVGGLLVDPAGEKPLTEFYRRYTGQSADFRELVRQKKHVVMAESFGGDLARLGQVFLNVCDGHAKHRDYSRQDVTAALAELAACWPVYRTYVNPRSRQVSADDERHIRSAVAEAKKHCGRLDPQLLDFFADIMLLRAAGPDETELVTRFQQFTGAAMAKGVEDTAFYCFNRLVSLNEVGDDPARFGVSVENFHDFCEDSQRRWPQRMLATSTHDTKRGEDVRARIHLLSEIPEAWTGAVGRWDETTRRHRTDAMPDNNDVYLLFQTMIGAWPIDAHRLGAYMRKACRESKRHTSWLAPNQAYEQAMERFISAVLADELLLTDFKGFLEPLILPGRVNSLTQVLAKATAPGVPDFYQGTELWDLSLVDPDNRRPVDYELRRRLLAELDSMTVQQAMARMDQGVPKLWTIRKVMALRSRRPELFAAASTYRPLHARGAKAAHVVAFARGGAAVTVVPRLVMGLGGNWLDTTIEMPAGRWTNCMTQEELHGGKVRLADLLRNFPVALLEAEGR